MLRTYFGRTLDDGLLHGNVAPEPAACSRSRPESTRADLWTAVHDAKADIITGGGVPTTVALPPSAIVAEEARLDGDQRPLYPDGLRGSPGSTWWRSRRWRATEALVYDGSGCYLVVAEDFRIMPPRDYAPAFQRDCVALRVSGQFAVAVDQRQQTSRRAPCSSHRARENCGEGVQRWPAP